MKKTTDQRIKELEEKVDFLISETEKDSEQLTLMVEDLKLIIKEIGQTCTNRVVNNEKIVKQLHSKVYDLERTKKDKEEINKEARKMTGFLSYDAEVYLFLIAGFTVLNTILILKYINS